MSEIALSLKNVTKIFVKDNVQLKAVDNTNIEVQKGELVTFLGPSGCGKTTTLRMVAGFEIPSEGTITFAGKDMTNVPVNQRGIGFVFQNYALFPHMTIYNNVAYGLKARGEKDFSEKVKNALSLVGLSGTENKYPNELSGGEQQRVALARVIVMDPALLLMDEPLSNLDAKLRIHMRTEIRKLQKKLGITCLYVTHDQAEALTVSDRIVVMSRGKVEQIGSPREVYSNPNSAFVADFIGQANIIKCKVKSIGKGEITATLPTGNEITAKTAQEFKVDDEAILVARPENIIIEDYTDGDIPATVVNSLFVGNHVEYELKLGDTIINANVPHKPDMKIFTDGEKVSLVMDLKTLLYLNH
ncbi:MAG: ABC transporter ATP-binding protein [Sphaerochaetaceae bacterium]|nr:ABC transporter ATP-binding protein [Sphaerochaetaceae bacterium]